MFELFTQVSFAGVTLAGFGQILLRRFPAKLKATAAPVPHIEPVLMPPRPPLDMQKAAALGRDREGQPIELDGNGNSIRPPRHRRVGIAKEKLVDLFVQWSINEETTGYFISAHVYEAFREFAWQNRYEELDRGTFLSLLAVAPGVMKKRPYIQTNETYRHLRRFANGAARVTVYRIPTAQELAAAKHKNAMRAADALRGARVPKARLEPGGHKSPRAQPTSINTHKNNNLGLSASVLDEAA